MPRRMSWPEVRIGNRVVFLTRYHPDNGLVTAHSWGRIEGFNNGNLLIKMDQGRQVIIRNAERQVQRGLLGVSLTRRLYKHYPKCHWFLAGDATANSLPAGAYEYIAEIEVHKNQHKLFRAAEEALVKGGLTDEALFRAGYGTNGGMCVDQPDECIGDIEDPVAMEAEWAKLYAKWGVPDKAVRELVYSLY